MSISDPKRSGKLGTAKVAYSAPPRELAVNRSRAPQQHGPFVGRSRLVESAQPLTGRRCFAREAEATGCPPRTPTTGKWVTVERLGPAQLMERGTRDGCGDAMPERSFARLRYLTGFGNEFESEALPGALPVGQNNPQVTWRAFALHT